MHYLDFPLWLRSLHFCNLLFVSLLIRSGLEILGAHPKLYWNDNCLPESAWLNFRPGIPGDRRVAPTPQFGHAAISASAAPNRKSAVSAIAFFLLSALYVLLYLIGIVAALRSPWVSQAVYVAAALIWLIPDRRIENVLPRNEA